MTQIFISHSNKDYQIAEKVCGIFKSDGFDCYMAEHYKGYGHSLSEKLMEALDNSDVIIVIFTKQSMTSLSVGAEIGYAKKSNKLIIPLVEKNVNTSILTQDLEHVKFDVNNLNIACKKISHYLDQDENGDISNDSIEETILLSDDAKIYTFELDENGKIFGNIQSDEPINVYVVSDYGLKCFNEDEEFDYKEGGSDILEIDINFSTYRGGKWHVIIENEDYDAEIEVSLRSN